jgi:integrase
LRHTHATAALYAGVPDKVVSANLGHANIQITRDFYAHVLADQRDEAAETVDEFMFAAQLSRRSLPRS